MADEIILSRNGLTYESEPDDYYKFVFLNLVAKSKNSIISSED